MKRKFTTYPVNNFTEFKTKMLSWLKQFSIFCLLDNHQYNFSKPSFECLLGVTSIRSIEAHAGIAFKEFLNFKANNNDWIFGHFAYDLKNEIDALSSEHFDGIKFPDLFFFIPEIVIILNEKELKIGILKSDAEEIYQSILSSEGLEIEETKIPEINSRFSKDEYLSTVKKLQQHILRGDCYEINFCQEFYAKDAVIDPYSIYQKLSSVSPNPFSAFYRVEDKYLVCASPERFLRKVGSKIISQPIKGTAKRMTDKSADEFSREELFTNNKERSENVMIVDLVRNDLSKVCEEDSVTVEELFGIYSFPQVHQMISTVSGRLTSATNIIDIIKATFPMGSMTGAPKRRVLQLIEKYERTKRGLFSGAVGYISPADDFDFNVVIRSILYNATAKYLSIQAGSAITFYSNAEKEYEECLLKIAAMQKVVE